MGRMVHHVRLQREGVGLVATLALTLDRLFARGPFEGAGHELPEVVALDGCHREQQAVFVLEVHKLDHLPFKDRAILCD